MKRFRNFMPLVGAALIGAAILAAPTQARADFVIRATDVLSGGAVNATVTQSGASNPNGSGFLTFSSSVGNFIITVVTHIATTGPGFTAASDTINITYNGPTGATSDKLIVEVLGNKFTNPTAPALSNITSNGSPSTSGLSVASVTMTSGVLAGNLTALDLGAAGTTLGGQLGMTTGIGSMGVASSVLVPNPATGAPFAIVNPFTFYQTFTFDGQINFGSGGPTDNGGSLSAGSTVSSLPAPAGLVLALTGLPVMGVSGWLRRRKALKTV